MIKEFFINYNEVVESLESYLHVIIEYEMFVVLIRNIIIHHTKKGREISNDKWALTISISNKCRNSKHLPNAQQQYANTHIYLSTIPKVIQTEQIGPEQNRQR